MLELVNAGMTLTVHGVHVLAIANAVLDVRVVEAGKGRVTDFPANSTGSREHTGGQVARGLGGVDAVGRGHVITGLVAIVGHRSRLSRGLHREGGRERGALDDRDSSQEGRDEGLVMVSGDPCDF